MEPRHTVAEPEPPEPNPGTAAMPAADSLQDEELCRVLEGFLSELEEGRPADPKQLLAQHPALAPRLATCLAGLRLLDESTSHAALGPATGVGRELGDYTIVQEIGRGGMGVVYEAVQRTSGRHVALKILPPAASLDSRQLLRFRHEAVAASHLRHSHIVPVYEVGSAGGLHYYTMQLIAGASLATFLQRQRRRKSSGAEAHDSPGSPLAELQWDREDYFPAMARFIRAAAEALDHAHQVGIVHRDIKPANLLVDTHGHLWVTDFGLAAIQGAEGLTATGDLVGTLRYMSPEQASARRGVVDHRTDVYALGVTLYELLTLEPALSGGDRAQLLAQLSHDDPPAPRRLNPRIPRDLETITLKAMAHAPEDRYATAATLADDLRRFLDGNPIQARRPGFASLAGKWLRRNRAWAAAIGLFVLTAAIGLGVSTAIIWRALRAEEKQRAVAESRELDSRQNLYDAQMNLALADWQTGHVTRVVELLDRQRPKPGEEDLRGFEWYHLWRLCHHGSRGKLPGHQGAANAVAAGAGVWATTGDDGTIRIWDQATSRPRGVLTPKHGKIRGLAISASRQRLAAACDDGAVRVWDLKTSEQLANLPSAAHTARSVAFSGDGRTVLAAGAGGCIVWKEDTGHAQVLPNAHGYPPNCCAVTVDGSLAASAGNDRRVLLWDLTSDVTEPLELGQHRTYVLCIAFSSDGRTLLTGSEDGFVQLWDVAARKRHGEPLRRHAGAVSGAAFSPDGRQVATVSWDGSVKVWGPQSGTVLHQHGHPGQVFAVTFSDDGRTLLSAGEHGLVRVWDLAAPLEPLVLAGHKKLIRAVTFSADAQQLASASADESLRVWDLNGRHAPVILEVKPRGNDPSWFADAGLASGGNANWLMGAAFCQRGEQVISADFGGRVRVWETASGRELDQFDDAEGPLWSLALSPDGKTLAGAGYRSNIVTLWDVATRKKRATLQGHKDRIWSVAFLPDSRTVVSSAGDRTVRLWDVASGNSIKTIDVPAEFCWSLAISPDGRTLAIGADDRRIRLWDLPNGREQLPLGQHAASIRCLAFFPDGKSLASGGDDGTVKIWGVATRQERATLHVPGSSVWSLAISRNGHALAAGDNDGTITVWRAASDSDVAAME